MKLALAVLILCFQSTLWAQSSFRSSPFSNGFGLRGVNTYGGFGFAEFDVKSPRNDLRMNQGIFAFLGGEREINDDGTSITISFNYMTTDGQATYNYTTLDGTNYVGTNIGFDSTNYQLGIGVRQRFFPNSWLRPYLEAGGLFGYHEIKYTDNVSTITGGNPAGIDNKDGLTGFGYYGEAGFEIDFTDSYGIRLGGRYQSTTTRAFETLANRKVTYETLVFQLAFLLRI